MNKCKRVQQVWYPAVGDGTYLDMSSRSRPVIEVVIGGWGNSGSKIRPSLQGKDISPFVRGKVLDPNAFTHFVIDYSGPDIIVIREGIELMRAANWKNHITDVVSIGLATAWGADGYWRLFYTD